MTAVGPVDGSGERQGPEAGHISYQFGSGSTSRTM